MDMAEVLERAKRQLANSTGLTPVGITRAFKDDEGWHVEVELLEFGRVLPATDLLGDYEVLLGEEGGMLKFERKRTRRRGEPLEEEER